jgi:hypothetical protein
MPILMTKPKKTKVKAKEKTAQAGNKVKIKNSKLTKTQPLKNYVVIDHPRNGEVIRSDYYAFRLGTSPSNRVEVCVNGKDWMPCRNSVGYWWFDWFNYTPGTYKLKARAIKGNSKTQSSKTVRFKVKR